MNDLLYNAEGYKDETAYKAILQAERGSENMSGYEINKGEIWEVEGNGYGNKLVVVLSCYERYAATVMLQDQEPGSNAVPVKARDIMYADAGRLGWTFYDKMVDFVRTLSEDESYELRRRIAERRLHEDLAAASKEAEIYKGLYEQLLARALG